MKARVDPDLCIGCGICPDVAPKVFEMGTDDKAHTKVDPVPEELQAACKDAADQCPQAGDRSRLSRLRAEYCQSWRQDPS